MWTDLGKLKHNPGKFRLKQVLSDGLFEVEFERAGFGQPQSKKYHEIVVRHGPEPAIAKLLPDTVASSLRPGRGDQEDPTRDRLWSPGFLHSQESERSLTDLAEEYAQREEDGAKLLLSGVHGFRSLTIRRHQGRVEFVVDLDGLESGSPTDRPSSYNGLPVHYQARH